MSETVLDKPAKVGAGTFGAGAKWATVISAAQRLYDYSQEDDSENNADEFTRNLTEGVIAANKILHRRITELEQQLKTAKADGVREFTSRQVELMRMYNTENNELNENIEHIAGVLTHQAEEYANNLEGK